MRPARDRRLPGRWRSAYGQHRRRGTSGSSEPSRSLVPDATCAATCETPKAGQVPSRTWLLVRASHSRPSGWFRRGIRINRLCHRGGRCAGERARLGEGVAGLGGLLLWSAGRRWSSAPSRRFGCDLSNGCAAAVARMARGRGRDRAAFRRRLSQHRAIVGLGVRASIVMLRRTREDGNSPSPPAGTPT